MDIAEVRRLPTAWLPPKLPPLAGCHPFCFATSPNRQRLRSRPVKRKIDRCGPDYSPVPVLRRIAQTAAISLYPSSIRGTQSMWMREPGRSRRKKLTNLCEDPYCRGRRAVESIGSCRFSLFKIWPLGSSSEKLAFEISSCLQYAMRDRPISRESRVA